MIHLELTAEEAAMLAVIVGKMRIVRVGIWPVTQDTSFDRAILSLANKLYAKQVYGTAYDPTKHSPAWLHAECAGAPLVHDGMRDEEREKADAAIREYDRLFALIVERVREISVQA